MSVLADCWLLIADTWLLIPGGAIAQLGERLLCKQEVVGSIPSGSTSLAALQRRQAKPNETKVARRSFGEGGPSQRTRPNKTNSCFIA